VEPSQVRQAAHAVAGNGPPAGARRPEWERLVLEALCGGQVGHPRQRAGRAEAGTGGAACFEAAQHGAHTRAAAAEGHVRVQAHKELCAARSPAAGQGNQRLGLHFPLFALVIQFLIYCLS